MRYIKKDYEFKEMIMKNLLNLLLLFSLFGGFWSCSEDEAANALPVENEYKLTNQRYGNNDRNIMDVYLPANRTENTPFLLIIHGGGWVEGDKSIFTSMQQLLLENNIASASMNYRFVSESVNYKDLMQGVGDAIDYCVEYADAWTTRKNKFAIFGHSAGAHMAMLYAYRFDRNKISAVIEAAGPTNFYDTGLLDVAGWVSFLPTIEKLADAKYVQGQPLNNNFKAISPLWNVKNVPTLMVQGTGDIIVWNNQAQQLDAKMAELGYTKELYSLEGADHNFSNITTEKRNEMNSKVMEWIKRYSN
jgi:acetyl esterase/lipase